MAQDHQLLSEPETQVSAPLEAVAELSTPRPTLTSLGHDLRGQWEETFPGFPSTAVRAISAVMRSGGLEQPVQIQRGPYSTYDPNRRLATQRRDSPWSDYELLHELGHAVIDDPDIAAGRYDAVLRAIEGTRRYQQMKMSYGAASDELLAQAYAQRAVIHSSDPKLQAQLRAYRASRRERDEPAPAWSLRDFKPVLEALDVHFATRKLEQAERESPKVQAVGLGI